MIRLYKINMDILLLTILQEMAKYHQNNGSMINILDANFLINIIYMIKNN